jgi:hypothetical protein
MALHGMQLQRRSLMADPRSTSNPQPNPKWEQAWQQRQTEIDSQIVDHFSNSSESRPEAVNKLTGKLSRWFRDQKYDAATQREVKAFTEAPEFGQHVEQRVQRLADEGRIPPGQMRQGG